MTDEMKLRKRAKTIGIIVSGDTDNMTEQGLDFVPSRENHI